MSIEKRKQVVKEKLLKKFENKYDPRYVKTCALIDLIAESNIPAGYWTLTMKSFSGSDKLKEIVEQYMSDIKDRFAEGESICLAGNQGTGKTMSSICILKQAIKYGFSAHYTTASDIFSLMMGPDKYKTRNMLRDVDFLVIDELDSRFFPSDSQKENFSGIYEGIFRHRSHNMLPTIICTNETNDILNVFYGAAKQSVESLNNQYLTVYPVVGKDFRKGSV